MMLRVLNAMVVGAVLGLAAPLYAQGADVAFDGAAHDSAQPVEVTSNRLSIDQSDGVTIFSGDVVVIQGDMRLTADELQVEYRTGDAAAQEGRIRRMHARGGVTLVTAGEAAEGREAVYDLDSGQIVIEGDVLVTQGPNAISGDLLRVDLAAGTGTVEGRVRTLLQSGGAAE